MSLPTYHIFVDGKGYSGESDIVEPAPAGFDNGWSGVRPRECAGIAFGEPIDIVGHINLRSHVERIVRRIASSREVVIRRVENAVRVTDGDPVTEDFLTEFMQCNDGCGYWWTVSGRTIVGVEVGEDGFVAIVKSLMSRWNAVCEVPLSSRSQLLNLMIGLGVRSDSAESDRLVVQSRLKAECERLYNEAHDCMVDCNDSANVDYQSGVKSAMVALYCRITGGNLAGKDLPVTHPADVE